MKTQIVDCDLDPNLGILSLITTGIDRNKNRIFLINLLTKNRLIQYLFPDDKNEFIEDSKNLRVITYNGHSFDIPFLLANGIQVKEEIDMYVFFKSYKLLDLKDYTFQTLFKYFTGEETNEISGSDTVKLIKKYEKNLDELFLQEIYHQGEKHILNLLNLYETAKKHLLNSSIPIDAYGKKLKLLPFSYNYINDYFEITLKNLGEFMAISLEFPTFSFFSVKNGYKLKLRKVEGYLDEQTYGQCVINDLGLKSSNFPRLNKSLYPIFIKRDLKENISLLANEILKRMEIK